MGDLFKCGNCKELFNDLFEFLDHKSQCLNITCEIAITSTTTTTTAKTTPRTSTTTAITTTTTTGTANPIIINPPLTNFTTLHYQNALVDIPYSISTMKPINVEPQHRPVIIQSTKLNSIKKYYSNPKIIISHQPIEQQQNQIQQLNYNSINNINTTQFQSSSSSLSSIVDVKPIIYTEYPQPTNIKCIKKISDILLVNNNNVNPQLKPQLNCNNYPIITDITDILQSPATSLTTTTTTATESLKTTTTANIQKIKLKKSTTKPRCNNRKKSTVKTNDRNNDDNDSKNEIEDKKLTNINVDCDDKPARAATTPPIINPTIKRRRQRKLIIKMDPEEEKLVNGRRYQCQVCGRRFRRNKIKGHMPTHLVWPDTLTPSLGTGKYDLVQGNYRCNFCEIRIESFTKLRSHMQTHKDVQLYMCPMSECRQLFGYEDLMIEHSQRCAFQSTIQCPICFRYFSLTTELDIHIMEHNNNKKFKNYNVIDGGKQATIVSELTNLENANTLATTIISDTAGVMTKNVPELSIDNGDGDDDGVVNSNKIKLPSNQCPICFVKYKNEIRMLKHLHSDNHEHLCEICNKMFMNNRALTKHLRTHRDYKRICPICHKSFTVQAYLNAHLLTHTGREYICDLCGKATTRKDSLARHFAVHQFPLQRCPIENCKKLFRRSHSYRAHQKMHKTQAKLSGIPLTYIKNIKKITFHRSAQNTKTTKTTKTNDNEIGTDVKSSPYLKRNVIIPGIVVKSGKITKGEINLKRYTITNPLINNNSDNFEKDKMEIESKFELENIDYSNQQKKIGDIDENNQIVAGNLTNIMKDFQQTNDNRNNFEFVDCKPLNAIIEIPSETKKKKLYIETVNCCDENPSTNELNTNNNNQSNARTHRMQTRGNRLNVLTTDPKITPLKIPKKSLIKQNSIGQLKPNKNGKNKSKPLKYSMRFKNMKTARQLIRIGKVENRREFDERKVGPIELSEIDKDPVLRDEPEQNQVDRLKKEPKIVVVVVAAQEVIAKEEQTPIAIQIESEAIKLRNTSQYTKWGLSHINGFFTRLSKKKTIQNNFECNLCGRRFQHNKLFNHIQSHRVWPITKKSSIGYSTFDKIDKLYRCPYCGETFPLHSAIRSHMSQLHKNEKLYCCPLSKCTKLFSNDDQYLRHCRECVFQSTVRCTICYRFFSNDHELNLHKIIIHKIIIDDDCKHNEPLNGNDVGDQLVKDKTKRNDDDDDNNNNNNNQNVIRIRDLKKFEQQCPVCLTKFKNKILLIKHMTKDTHNHRCLYCDKVFLTLSKFHRHTLSHRSTPKICHICGKTFSAQAYLNSHLLAHTECYTCDICQQTFARKNTLIKHIGRHRQPLYACTHTGCKAVYRRKDLILRHILKNDAHKMLITE